ncbi:MAG: hypothetical protein ABSE16_17035 [Verrucomicrobiota bacterium]|jgi:hypothetical protein
MYAAATFRSFLPQEIHAMGCGGSHAAFPVKGAAMQVHHGFDVKRVGLHAVNDGVGKAVEVQLAVVVPDFVPAFRLFLASAMVFPESSPKKLFKPRNTQKTLKKTLFSRISGISRFLSISYIGWAFDNWVSPDIRCRGSPLPPVQF